MTEPEEHDEDLFADLYEGDDTPAKPVQPAAPVAQPPVEPAEPVPSAPPAVKHEEPPQPEEAAQNGQHDYYPKHEQSDVHMNGGWGDGNAHHAGGGSYDDNYGPIGIKEDGKMFIGGLNWDTTDQSLKDYFSQFGEVTECTVMRDGATGRSRGFGFLTFKDPKTVNIVMVKEHYLDGKIIDPKRAIPREEQERTAKIFVGGVSQEATERDFREFFQQFGRVIDATLMMDKDTGRPRGFGFVTFDGAAAVDACLSGPLEILGKPIEVKPAQPRGNMRDGEDDKGGKFGRGRNDRYGRGHENQDNYSNQQSQNQNQNQNQQAANSATNGMSPAMMAQYWQRMQQYFQMMQQNMQAQMGQGQGMGPNPMAMQGQMNPAMMQQMMAMQQMNRPGGSPHPQSPGAGPMPGMPSNGQMNPAMMQQMQQMQQMQMQQQAAQGAGPGTFSPGPGMMAGQAAGPNRPGFNAQEQLLFEQQKYEQQQARRVQQQQFAQHHQYNTGGPTSWEGMYDDVPQPNLPPQGPGARGGMQGNFGGHARQMSPAQSGRGGMQHHGSQGSTPPVQPSNAPANAPTGPKNAGKPGANYRGGGRVGHRGFHPYARNG